MKAKRYRTTKAANFVAVVFALGTVALIIQSTPITNWTTRHAHATPQQLHPTPRLQLRPDARESTAPRRPLRLRNA